MYVQLPMNFDKCVAETIIPSRLAKEETKFYPGNEVSCHSEFKYVGSTSFIILVYFVTFSGP